LQKVKDKGDKAIRKFSKEFDGASIKRIQVSEKRNQYCSFFTARRVKTSHTTGKEKY